MKQTFLQSETRTAKSWMRKGKWYYRSAFDGKVRPVPKDIKQLPPKPTN